MQRPGGSNGTVGDVCECVTAADCDDGLFCNGDESCVGEACQPGTDPCEPLFCDEGGDTCFAECAADADCDDGLWCNGH